MTYNDIITKFKIEYDKANVTSSYPSLTEYEIATVLDKAYLNLIAQKFTGNNTRRAAFEVDSKAVSDLQPLVTTCDLDTFYKIENTNSTRWEINKEDFLYFISAQLLRDGQTTSRMDSMNPNYMPIKLISHEMSDKFLVTPYNSPWIKIPVGCIEDDNLIVFYDPHDNVMPGEGIVKLTYVKKPLSFVSSDADTEFELNEEMAEQLVSLAVTYSLENIESQRLSSHVGIKGLES